MNLYNWAQANRKNILLSDIPEAFLDGCVYYQSMQYINTEEVAQMVQVLLSNFGGVLG